MRRALAAAVLLPALAACAPRLIIPGDDQARLGRELKGARRFLRVAVWSGPFYGDKGMVLVSDRPYAELDQMQTPGGEHIAPPPADRILPPGTPVTVQEVEFPSGGAFVTRAVMTPRYEPWLLFRVPDDDRVHVLVLSRTAASADELIAEMDRVVTASDPSPQLKALPASTREAVLRKELVDGMSRQAAGMAWGLPDKIVMDRPARTEEWTWMGSKRRAFFQEDRLTRWSR
ncbi:MAG TPA: hypothetical protein VFR85_02790 [Anaeromyxobacteraceae bacterium]|nr:hypothetical protein [Anaeromyxobacteraceae bacterium]